MNKLKLVINNNRDESACPFPHPSTCPEFPLVEMSLDKPTFRVVNPKPESSEEGDKLDLE